VVAGEGAEAGVQTVDRFAAGQYPIDHVAGSADANQRFGVDIDGGPVARDSEHVIDGQAIATEKNVLAC